MIVPTRKDESELTEVSYYVPDIKDYFEWIF